MQKTNFKTRLLALLTAAFMLVMCVPFAAFAEDAAVVTVTFNKGNEYDGNDWTPYLTKKLSATDSTVKAPPLPNGYYWKSNVGTKDLKVNDMLTYDDVKAAGENVGYSPVEGTPAEPEKPATLQKIIVSFNDAAGKEMAAGYTLTAGDVNSIAGDVYATVCPEGKELDHWTYAGKTFAKGSDVSFEQLAAIIGTAFTSEGEAYVNFVPEFKDKAVEPTPVTLKKIIVSFNDAAGKEMAAGYTLTAGDVNSVAGDVYATACPEGKELDYWTYAGKTFAKGSDVTFEQLAEIIGTAFTSDGEAYVNFVPEFKDKAVEPTPVTLKKIVVSFNDAAGKEMAAGYTLTAENNLNSIAGDVYAGACPEGKELDYWTFSGKKFAKGADVTFEQLAAIIGTNYTDEGVSYVNFVPEFKNVAASLTKIKMIFTKADGATSVFATGELTADSEWYVLPDAAGVINLADGEKLTGWTLFQNGAKYAAGEKVTFESLKELAGKNVDNDGVAYLNFYADLKTDVELKNITIKYVEDKDGAQEDVAAPQNNFTAKDEFTILTDNLYDGKVPAGKKLIGWQYKNGGNTTNFVKGEHVKFDTLKALLNGNWDNEGNAWVTLTPVFQDVKSNNSSSSSASSSSNKTTTASNEKQVVKAAAAPANTTKVLPKTGASNVAPLLGGSLAVVALLMGYGVYSLVLRKKD